MSAGAALPELLPSLEASKGRGAREDTGGGAKGGEGGEKGRSRGGRRLSPSGSDMTVARRLQW
ncbi:hypothetical protein GmRootV35_01950 [Variovorax sp. V35]